MNKKSKNNYRIFIVEQAKDKHSYLPKKITMKYIYAKNDDDAYNQLKEYIKIANKQFTYYVEPWSPHIIIRNGKRYVFEDCFDAWEYERKSQPWYKRLYNNITISCWSWFVRRPKDVYYWFRDLFYLIKNKQQYKASWSIDKIMLDTLRFNIPILKKYKHCLSWKMLEKAYIEKHPEMTKEENKNFLEHNCQTYGDDVEKRSIELEQEMFDKLMFDIDAYEYYMGGYDHIGYYGDADDERMKAIDAKLRSTLPLIKGSYDRYDYKKLNALVEKHWNRIWETMRIYGQEFND